MASTLSKKKTLIVCDVQPDVVNKLPQPSLFVDLVATAVQAARTTQEDVNIVYTMLKLEPGYAQVQESHPRLGILRRIGAKNTGLKWFTSSELSVAAKPDSTETVVTRSTFLPHASDTKLLEVLKNCLGDSSEGTHQFTVVGYGPTVQAICNLLGDILSVPKVQVLRECVGDENKDRALLLQTGGSLLLGEDVVSLVDYLEATDLLHEQIDLDKATVNGKAKTKYVSNCDRGGHLSLFMPYLLRDHGYTEWPIQPWYQEQTNSLTNKQYNCPLGRRMVDLCDEPKFSSCVRFFLAGRQHLDEKDLLHAIVPEFMPPTFPSMEAANAYAAEQPKNTDLLWFIKAVNQNGGRAVRVTRDLATEPPLGPDEQLQVHIPRPLLYEERKCHVKTYQFLSCTTNGDEIAWQVYMHDLFYLSTASRPWSTDDLSDEAQITTMRTHRLYPDNPWRVQWNLTAVVRAKMQTLMERAVEQKKLVVPEPIEGQDSVSTKSALQFEINSADWMLDEDGRVYLIECNGIPVLYDAGMPQALVTKGLNLYDGLYQQNPDAAVVNDHDLIQEAVGLALTGKVPKTSLWTHLTSIPVAVME